MTTYTIVHCLTGATLWEGTYPTLRLALEDAILHSANLEGAYLRNANLEGAALEGAYLKGANLEGAVFEGANLRGANLRGANLEGANLRWANLEGANLRWANLKGANLKGAALEGAALEGANLGGANLEGVVFEGANLRDAYLRGANLEGANLRGTDLTGVATSLGIPLDPQLPQQILDTITQHPETWDQRSWHSTCGTKHCIAGWATTLAGPLGAFLDRQWGTATAATLLLWHPGCVLPSFADDATEEETLGRLRQMAAHLAHHGGPA